MQWTLENCSSGNGRAYGGWDSVDACLYYISSFGPADDASQKPSLDSFASTIAASDRSFEKRTTLGYCFEGGASLDSIDLTSYVDIWCDSQNGHVIYPGNLYLQTGNVDGARFSLGMRVTLTASQSCPQSYTIDAGTCASDSGLLWMLLNCHAPGDTTYGGFLNNGCETWEKLLTSTVARVETNASRAAPGPSASQMPPIEARQIGNFNCSVSPAAPVSEPDDAVAAFCNNVSSYLPLGATQSFSYELPSGHEVVLSRTSGCSGAVNQTQIGYGLCISPFQDILDQCPHNQDQLSGTSPGGSTSVWGCIDYSISIEPAPASQHLIRGVTTALTASTSHDNVTCNALTDNEASVSAIQNMTSLYCSLWAGTLLPPNSTVSGQAPIGQGDDTCTYGNLTVSNGADCGHLLVIAPQCEEYFGRVSDHCGDGSSSTRGGAYRTGGCQSYALMLVAEC